MTIGDRIKKCRIESGMSVNEMASKLSKDRATIYRYENGDVEGIPINVILSIAEILKVSPAYLIGWDETNCEIDEYIKKMKSLSQSDREIVTRLIDSLYERGKS